MTEQTYNVSIGVLNYLTSNPEKQIFKFGDSYVNAGNFRNIIVNIALNMKKNGVTASSCVAIETIDIVTATAISIACGLFGCKWVRLTTYVVNSKLLVTHVIHESDIRAADDSITLIKIAEEFYQEPTDVEDRSFSGYNTENDIWMLAQSSGTTGSPKFIPITYLDWYTRVNANAKEFLGDYKNIQMLYHPLKSSVQYRIITAMLNDVVIGRDLDNYLLVGSLGQVKNFIRDVEPPEQPKNIMVDVTGSATSKDDAELLLKFFKTVRLCYGSTEVSRISQKVLNSIEDYNGSVGKEFENCKVTLEGDNIVVERYEYKFLTGDTGYVQDDEIYITGRVNEILNIGGVKINPVDLDKHIKTVDGIKDCLVFDNDGVLSVLVVGKQKSAKVVYGSCLKKFGISKTPKNFYFVKTIPTNENEKPVRSDAHLYIEGAKCLTFSEK